MPTGGRSVADRVPGVLRSLGARELVAGPVVTERCVGCRQCIEACPVQTIVEVQGRARIRLDRCIRCYCCHELCPEQAIELRQPALARLLARVVR
jgi:formate hydrogenlyase subunit 6/NADH:ubiquinone oxidoreductase subunit I